MADLKFDLNDFSLDPEAVRDGVWIDFGGGASFCIAPFDNQGFEEMFRQLNKPYVDLGKKADEDEQEEILCRAMAMHIVRGWKNVYRGDEPVVFSIDAAFELLTTVPRVRSKIISEAQKLDNYKLKVREDDVEK